MKLSAEEKKLVVAAMMLYPGMGPMPKVDTLQYFVDSAKKSALRKAVKGGRLNEKGIKLANKILARG